MRRDLEAIYENGVLRPLEPLDLAEHARVRLTLDSEDDWLDRDAIIWASQEAGVVPTLAEVRARLRGIRGTLADAVIAERGDF
jgi:hypothetical protein